MFCFFKAPENSVSHFKYSFNCLHALNPVIVHTGLLANVSLGLKELSHRNVISSNCAVPPMSILCREKGPIGGLSDPNRSL